MDSHTCEYKVIFTVVPATASKAAIRTQETFRQVAPEMRFHGLNCGGGEVAVVATQHSLPHTAVAWASRGL
jgi:hypothetical protein